MKPCITCKIAKPLNTDNFSRDKTSKDGFYHYCKPCAKIRNDRYRAEHLDYFRKKGKERYDPSLNPARYQKYRTEYLARRAQELQTVRGRLIALLGAARKRAQQKGYPFELDIKWVLERYETQNGACCLTGLPFTLEFTPRGKKYHPYNPSLDKIVPAEGYTKQNTRLVCVAVNIALNEFGEEVLRKVCEGYLTRNGVGWARNPSDPGVNALDGDPAGVSHVRWHGSG